MARFLGIIGAVVALVAVAVAVGAPSPAQAAGRQVAVVVGATPLSPSDQQIVDLLTGAGDTVSPVVDAAVAGTDLSGVDVIVITSSVTPSLIPASLADLEVPMVVMEAYLYGKFGMATSFAERTGPSVRIRLPGHPLAGGLTESKTVQSSASRLNAARIADLGAGAEVVATVVGSANWAAVFGFPFAADLVTGQAPAGRVGLFPIFGSVLNANGVALLRAAVDWAADQTPGNRAPVDLTVDTTTLPEVGPSADVLATFSATDPDGDPLRYGCFCPDFLAVADDGSLTAVGPVDHETTPTVTFEAYADDIGQPTALRKTFTFTVIDDPTDNVDDDSLAPTVAGLSARLDALEAAQAADVTALGQRLDDIESANAALASRVGDVENRVDTAFTLITGLGTRVGGTESRLSTLEGQVPDDLASSLELLQAGIDDNLSALRALDGRLDTVEDRLVGDHVVMNGVVAPDYLSSEVFSARCPSAGQIPVAPSYTVDANIEVRELRFLPSDAAGKRGYAIRVYQSALVVGSVPTFGWGFICI